MSISLDDQHTLITVLVFGAVFFCILVASICSHNIRGLSIGMRLWIWLSSLWSRGDAHKGYDQVPSSHTPLRSPSTLAAGQGVGDVSVISTGTAAEPWTHGELTPKRVQGIVAWRKQCIPPLEEDTYDGPYSETKASQQGSTMSFVHGPPEGALRSEDNSTLAVWENSRMMGPGSIHTHSQGELSPRVSLNLDRSSPKYQLSLK